MYVVEFIFFITNSSGNFITINHKNNIFNLKKILYGKKKTCNCKTKPSSFYSGSYEEGLSLLSAFSITCLIDHNTEQIYQCSVSGTVRGTRFLPGGGIYGDIEWWEYGYYNDTPGDSYGDKDQVDIDCDVVINFEIKET